MEYIVFIASLFIGFVIGTIFGIYGSLRYQERKAKKITDEIMSQLKNPRASSRSGMEEFLEKMMAGSDRPESVNKRLKEVNELQEKMMELVMAVDEPQRNSLDGRGKQFQGGELDAMKEEMDNILQSILDDGFDPVLGVMGEMGIERVKLSEVMKQKGYSGEAAKKEPKPEGRVLQLVKDEVPPVISDNNDEV